MLRSLAAAVLAAALSGCLFYAAAGPLVARDQDVQVVNAPAQDRCALIKEWSLKERCADFKARAYDYVQKLSAGDGACLDHGFGEVVGAACRARGKVIDTKRGWIDFQVQEAQSDSTLRDWQGKTLRCSEGALIDMYLKNKGF